MIKKTTKLIFLFLFIVGCGISPGPKDVLFVYLDNFSKSDYVKAYESLSSRDKAIKSLQEFSPHHNNEFAVFNNIFYKKMTFNIKEVKVTGDKALAFVDITSPDPSKVMGEFFGVAMKSAFSGGKPDEKELGKIAEKMKDKDFPMITRTEQYDLVKDKDGWRVYMGWENEKKIKDLRLSAEKLEKQKQFADAKAKYSEIQALSSRDSEVPKKIKELDEKILKYKEKQAYFPNIEVKGVHIGKGIFGEKGVFGEVKNKGNKSLKSVEITTHCLDKEGKTVFEKTYHPVLVLEHSFSMRDNQPLKPNYSRQFGCKLDDAPSDWSGKVRVEVTDLEFE